MQLRQPEALGVLDEHHARIRHVDPDLDDGGGDEHVHLAGREGRHRRVAEVRLLLAVHDPDAELGQPLTQALDLGLALATWSASDSVTSGTTTKD